jgi:hypothetical protein
MNDAMREGWFNSISQVSSRNNSQQVMSAQVQVGCTGAGTGTFAITLGSRILIKVGRGLHRLGAAASK